MSDPVADRPHIPGYGVPRSKSGLLKWAWARERLERSMIYRFATSSLDGQPHVIPIWGAWVDDAWYVEGGPTRWKRNLRSNPRLSIEIDEGSEVVIVEGDGEAVTPKAEAAVRIAAGYEKYKLAGLYEVDPANWSGGGLWRLRPRLAIAWSSFPKDITRFRF